MERNFGAIKNFQITEAWGAVSSPEETELNKYLKRKLQGIK